MRRIQVHLTTLDFQSVSGQDFFQVIWVLGFSFWLSVPHVKKNPGPLKVLQIFILVVA